MADGRLCRVETRVFSNYAHIGFCMYRWIPSHLDGHTRQHLPADLWHGWLIGHCPESVDYAGAWQQCNMYKLLLLLNLQWAAKLPASFHASSIIMMMCSHVYLHLLAAAMCDAYSHFCTLLGRPHEMCDDDGDCSIGTMGLKWIGGLNVLLWWAEAPQHKPSMTEHIHILPHPRHIV